jgi:hypothetical protein
MTMTTCAVSGCKTPAVARGWCFKHYQRWRRGKDPAEPLSYELPRPTCEVNGCDRPARTRGWCAKHYGRWRDHGDATYERPKVVGDTQCSIEGCDRMAISRTSGVCSFHYRRRKRGLPMDAPIGSLSTRKSYHRNMVPCHCGATTYAKGMCRKCYMVDYRQKQKERTNA